MYQRAVVKCKKKKKHPGVNNQLRQVASVLRALSIIADGVKKIWSPAKGSGLP